MEKPKSKNKNLKIEFKYEHSDNYIPHYISGVYGGITPRRTIIANFFLERQLIPESEVNEITEDGKVGNLVEKKPQVEIPTVVRYIPTGIIMDYDTAIAIHDWLEKKIKSLEKIDVSDNNAESNPQ